MLLFLKQMKINSTVVVAYINTMTTTYVYNFNLHKAFKHVNMETTRSRKFKNFPLINLKLLSRKKLVNI